MRKIIIESEPKQEFLIPFEDDFIKVELDFRMERWFMNVSYKDKKVNGLKLASGVLMLQGKNLPFDIFVDDKGLGIDPFRVDCFESGLFDFYLLEREDIEVIRN